MSKVMSAAVAAAVILVCDAGSAQAYDCRVPALADAVKKAVCANSQLQALDRREIANRRSLGASLPVAARTRVEADRTIFVRTRQTCLSDTRCLESTYTSQLRLYDRLRRCAPDQNPATCTQRLIDKHRENLHRSM